MRALKVAAVEYLALAALGQRSDAELPAGAAAGSQFTVTVANDDLSDFTDATARGHNKTVYSEPDFMNHIHQAILWAVHRMQ